MAAGPAALLHPAAGAVLSVGYRESWSDHEAKVDDFV